MKLIISFILLISVNQIFATERTFFGERSYEEKGKYVYERHTSFVGSWNSWLKTTKIYIKNSGFIRYRVALQTSKVSKEILFGKSMVGPYFVSEKYNLIFFCESNSMDSTKKTFMFDSKANLLSTIKHSVYQRDCFQSDDQKLYILHYNLRKDSKWANRIVVISYKGAIVSEKFFFKPETLRVVFENQKYEFQFPKPDFPG